jgi:Protein of unknown function (DUF2752)
MSKFFLKVPVELIFWVSALAFIFFSAGPGGEAHFTLCPLANLGIEWCPGCGLGHSIGYAFKGEIGPSFSSHPFGIIALGIILHRIFTLLKVEMRKYGF